jgi:hypothetical protein
MGSQRGAVPSTRVRLLDADPELGRWLTPDEVVAARERSVVPVLRLRAGPWTPPPRRGARTDLGFLVLDGLLARDEELCDIVCMELIGPGDLVQPWTQRPEEALVPRRVSLLALERTSVAMLGPSFVAALQRWPALHDALLDRAMRHCAWLSTEHALCQLGSVDNRLLVLFWHLAERWGRVVPGGVAVPLPLSHATLGHLAGARRPTVTLALKRLCADGRLTRRSDRTWIVRGRPPEALRRPAARRAAAVR